MRTTAHRTVTIAIALGGLVLAGCWRTPEPDHQHAKLGAIAYDVPAAWQRNDRGPRTSVWSPLDNERKESVTVISTDLDPALVKAGPAALSKLLAEAQGGLPAAHVTAPEPVTTAAGLHGFRVVVDFSPLGSSSPRYTRVHAILVDGTTLVHVVYTAAGTDPEEQALGVVLATVHHEEG